MRNKCVKMTLITETSLTTHCSQAFSLRITFLRPSKKNFVFAFFRGAATWELGVRLQLENECGFFLAYGKLTESQAGGLGLPTQHCTAIV